MKKKVVSLTFISIFILPVIIGTRFNAAVVTSFGEASISNSPKINSVITSSRTIWVPDNYTKIQEAINSASDGDIIRVRAKTYYEQVTVDKSLTLIGENPSTTIIDGSLSADYVIKCNASRVNISGFTIQHGIHGIDLNYCSNITISDNIIANNSQFGIFLLYSSNNTIDNNTVSNNGDRGIYLRNHSSNNTVSNNTISNHNEWGIYLFNHSSNNIVSTNTILYSGDRGIYLIDADNNIFNGNRVLNNTIGISIRASAGNTLRNNKMAGNKYNFDISAVALGQYIQDIDPSNTVNGKPIYYWTNQANKQVPAGAGYVAAINSKNITIRGQTLTNNAQGVLFAYTTDSTIVNVNASYNNIGIHIVEDYPLDMPPKSGNNVIKDNILANNYEGIEFRFSSDNTFTGNTVTKNYYGVNSALCNNTLYHNNFVNNINLTYRNVSLSIINIWDNGYEGNYWSDYNGTDMDGDGIGDVPYVIDDKNQDNYPLMAPVSLADQINISDDRCDVGSLQTVAIHAVWAHNSSNAVKGSVYVNGTKHVTNDTGWISFNVVYYTVGKRVWTVERAIFEPNSAWIIFDAIKIVEGGVSKTQTNLNQKETVWFKAVYEYDNIAFDGTKGKLYVNGSEMTWSSENDRWEYKCSFDTAGTRIFQVSGVTDNQYALTAINDAVGAQTITWVASFWMRWWFWAAIVAAGIVVFVLIYFLRMRKSVKRTGLGSSYTAMTTVRVILFSALPLWTCKAAYLCGWFS